MSIQNIVSLVGGLNNMTAIKSPDKMYYCKFQDGEKYLWGFLSPSDPRLETVLIKKEVSIEQHQQLLSGGNIVYYNDEVFNADNNQYYLNDNGDFVKRSDEEYNKIVADAKKAELVQTLYTMKAAKAYGGVTVNDAFIFETNQTAITNTVATLSLMSDTGVSSWKFYTKDGEPVVQTVTKAQLFAIASFGRQMIDNCFAVEGEFLSTLENAKISDLISENWVKNFVETAQANFDEIENNITVTFN